MILDAGRVHVSVGCEDGRVADVRVVSDRPAAARVFVGQGADRVVAVLPMLFSLCGRAQGAAAAAAIAAARGAPPPPALEGEVLREAMAEHLWRLLMDEQDAEARSACLLGRQRLADRPAFAAWLAGAAGMPAEEIPGLAEPGRAAEWQQGDSLLARRSRPLRDTPGLREAVPLLPPMAGPQTLDLSPLLGQGFARLPIWHGRPAQTGPAARHRRFAAADWTGRTFLARWIVRLLELGDYAAGRTVEDGQPGRVAAVAVAPGRGRATVETARGLLMHEVALRDDKVADYVIVAPTEWNFHPEGALKSWLMGHPAGDAAELRAFVGDAVAALDPCVEWDLLIA
ncbi:MAG: nickel-dependent hydrogenase large subunit [Rhodocyclaceae bacterium]|nr:nickel-dependent hydrogenase large subunit [Rhodocyclaceae bacterium]